MHTLYGSESPHLAVLGSHHERLTGLIRTARTRHLRVSAGAAPATSIGPITFAIVTIGFDPNASREHWHDHSTRFHLFLDSVLSIMANPSAAMLIGFGAGDTDRDHDDVRETLSRAVEHLEARAAGANGIDVTANAIAVPPSVDDALLQTRLRPMLARREIATSGVVLDYDDILHQSVLTALLASDI